MDAGDPGWRLVLWDVDRTLLHVEGVSRQVYEDAFLAVVGRPLERLADMAGRTDRWIITETLALHGVPDADGKLESFYGELGRAVRERRDLLRASGRALPGAQEALAAVAALPGVVQSVVTGNTREIAKEKLSALGLDGELDLEVGGYGDDASDRAELVRRARERVERKYGVPLGWGSVVVVGDTEHDVAGAVDNGAAAVGVTSGSSDTEQLRDAGAAVVLADLTDTEAVVDALLSAAQQHAITCERQRGGRGAEPACGG